jgi:hypothetical protein
VSPPAPHPQFIRRRTPAAQRLGFILFWGQLARRTSVPSTSATVITPGAGCSITSTALVSTTGRFRTSFRGAFFTGARLDFALATVRFVAFAAMAALRDLPRLAEFPLRSFARFCTFDAFLRLAMIDPWLVLRSQDQATD